MDLLQGGEGFAKFDFDVPLSVDVDAGEQGLVEQPALLVVALAVQVLRPGEQLKAGLDEPDAVGQLVLDAGEPFLDAVALVGDLAELLADPGDRHGVVRGEVEQVAFADVEPCDLGGQLVFEESGGGGLVSHELGDLFAHVGDELLAEGQGVVVPLDGVLDAGDVHVGAVALLGLLVTAEVVQVHVAVACHVLLDGEALDDAALVAGAAEDDALEEVVVDAAPVASGGACLDHFLDSGEQFGVDGGIVKTCGLVD